MSEVSLPRAHREFDVSHLWPRLKATVKVWRQRDRDRRFLAQMSAYERADINVPQSAIEREIAKPFWRA
ncbi:MAG: DUF1127 domain-containing protein [Rhodospirillaceae bacterium]|jgi:uncharacterized protein YjiS (DUF1127 family)|nr:DUF1127 domain-containing protein [Rhodospirillaceae bacterium]MBT4489529.1 DUF1127 domain-containing protein [Rhodospirillaceae bacterium]MBT5190739.1 DUF1127 domain-containing protein [Rhodospirillaceae bacterium]MBT5897542.1 DUF1127 domain-containing protein [Rhodospirillaceae bacterium]MBT6428532.1 DUF1127 domain-containing protein [Rhodospirillaceae bacterium]